MEVETRLVVHDPSTANLYLPKGEWMKLTTKLKSNKMTVILRIEGVSS